MSVKTAIEIDGVSNSNNPKDLRLAANRLERLADFLLALDRTDFNMNDWGYKKGDQDSGITKAKYCNTVCCIGGWATLFHPHLRITKYSLEYREDKYQVLLPEGDIAFATAFCLNISVATKLTSPNARHRTPEAAAIEVYRVIEALRDRADKLNLELKG